jgi:N-acetylmuramoyl-L-alanine amidase
MEPATKESDHKIPIKTNKKEFANLISNGILNDYVDLDFDN